MSTSAIPALIDALYEAATDALTDVKVYDGYGVSDDPGDFLMIGVEDVDSAQNASSASSEQGWANANYTARDESGDITCAAMSWNGDGDQKAARDAVFATTAALEVLLRANPSLGLPTLLWTSYGTSTELSQNQDENGALALLIFRVHFRARI